ncbi:hypothetical protein IAG44_05060 [Streptomyces roseirectus]|uniref:Uncharacterized protein n=1 Tax=Streptomyces roseirectus TaxID=2768066 RepID=A0A7H0IS25_9ACTN|nr:hypothetical protein [Streptomyces roseirectus]QNP75591.1 hypothetical protein IAG44_05060 [Streptomyces roseirectus]
MRAIGGLWRWRHNPVRRTTDLVEAWVAAGALLLVLVVAPVAGTVVGSFVQDALLRSVRDQQSTRFEITATVVKELKANAFVTDPDAVSGRDARSRVEADWTAPDGSAHHGPVTAALDTPHPGDRFALWTDGEGRPMSRPLDAATANTHAVLAGVGAALCAAGLVEGARRTIVWSMVRRRYARWDQAWDRAGPDWGRTGTGS